MGRGPWGSSASFPVSPSCSEAHAPRCLPGLAVGRSPPSLSSQAVYPPRRLPVAEPLPLSGRPVPGGSGCSGAAGRGVVWGGGLGDAAEAGLPPIWASPQAELTSARPCPPPPPPTSCPLPGLMLRPPRPRAEEPGGGRTQLSCPPRARPPVYPCDSPVPRGSCTEKGRPPHAQGSRSPPPPPSSLFNCQTGTGSVSPPQPPPASGLSGGVGSWTPAPLIPGLREGPCRGSGWGWPDLPLGSGATLGLAGCPAVWGRGFGSPASVVLGVWGR